MDFYDLAINQGATLRNKYTGEVIDNDRIIQTQVSGGLALMSNDGWTFAPNESLEVVSVSPTSTDTGRLYPAPTEPEGPELGTAEMFDDPMPSFSSDVQTVTKYGYFFGFDPASFQRKTISPVSCKIFKEINVGLCGHIELSANYISNDSSSVEFYIIDGAKEVAILPVEDKTVKNEQLFFGLNTRFTPDSNQSITIKCDGSIVNKTLTEVASLKDGVYTVSYTPTNGYKYTPENAKIKVKVIQRLYDESAEPPYIENILIRKYGGNAAWTE